jgi:hypothetical protein
MKYDYQDYIKNGPWRSYSVRPDPELSMEEKKRFVFFAYFGAILLGLIVGSWTHLFLTSFIMAHVVAFCLYAKAFPVRCPKCGGKILPRFVDDEEEPDRYYYRHHDCPKCEISWQSRKCPKPG